jgi:hypothetical protein
VVDLLEQRHRQGIRFEPAELIERGHQVAVELGWGGYKVFTFQGERIVLLRDCTGRDDALAQLAVG